MVRLLLFQGKEKISCERRSVSQKMFIKQQAWVLLLSKVLKKMDGV